jgi:hypothetical protein
MIIRDRQYDRWSMSVIVETQDVSNCGLHLTIDQVPEEDSVSISWLPC